MTKSELIALIAHKQTKLKAEDVKLATNCIIAQINDTLLAGDRVEVRGFGSFSLHYRPARIGRNPKTGEPVALEGKYVPHFKPGKQLRERIDT